MRIPRDSLAASVVLPVGLLALAINHDQPLVRNSLVYERAGLIRSGLDVRYGSRRRFVPAESEFFVRFWHSPDRSGLQFTGPAITAVTSSNALRLTLGWL